MARPDRIRVAVAVCTYRRNEALRLLLTALVRMAADGKDNFALGIVVVDDSAEKLARDLVRSFDDSFELGATYRHSGARNISKARNLAIETAAEVADWIAMTDDDCEPSDAWLAELLRIQAITGAQVVTGGLVRRAPQGTPKWLTDQPFLNRSRFDASDGQELSTAFTNNCLISSALVKANPDLRFKTEFGRIGGEDTVFFHEIARSGHTIRFARNALMYENEDEDRLTLRYQLRRFFWYGNTSVQTSLQKGVKRGKLTLHGFATIARAAAEPFSRIAGGQKPQMLYALARVCEGAGKLAGVVGIRVNHK
jgi:succinoglycan biosynthesis protein ExoM